MAEKWQLEAIHEQFDIFESLSQPYQNIPVNNYTRLIDVLSSIIQQHNMLGEGSIRKISGEVIKNSGNGNNIKLSFSVIITNEYNNNRLYKMPVIIVMCGNQLIFIDMSCSIYKSWAAFLKLNDLPSCEFCFPVDGQYKVGGKLQIEFAKSPKALSSSWKWSHILWACGGCIVVGVIVASYFYISPCTFYTLAENLIPLAGEFQPVIAQLGLLVLQIIRRLMQYRSGSIDWNDCMFDVFRILISIYRDFNGEIWEVLSSVKETLKPVYDYIRRKFSNFYSSDSSSTEHDMAAATLEIDADIRNVQDQQESRLRTIQTNSEGVGDSPDLEENLNENDSVVQHNTNQINSLNESRVHFEQMFENCRNECAFHTGIKDNEELNPSTKDLLDLSKHVADVLKTKNLNDAKDIFVALSYVVRDEYRNKMETYIKAVTAARSAAGHDIDIETYNRDFGVVGNPRDHFWNEALESIKEARNSFLLKKKMEQIKRQKKPFMVLIWKDEQNLNSLYKIKGIQGEGEISPRMILNILRESSCLINLAEDNMTITENNLDIIISFQESTIIVHQELTESNTYDGLLFISNRREVLNV